MVSGRNARRRCARNKYIKIREMGLCIHCRKAMAEDGMSTCGRCRIKKQEQTRKSYYKNKPKWHFTQNKK